MGLRWSFVIFTMTLFFSFTRAYNILKREKEILDDILIEKNYDPSIRPQGSTRAVRGSTGPVEVKVNIYLRSISEMDDVNMQYTVQLTFRQEWKDNRLIFRKNETGNIPYLTLTNAGSIWRPDAFFSNEKSGHFHDIVMPNVMIRIHPDGTVLYSTRISLKLSCPMDLRYYPMDVQECEISIASYAYTTDHIMFEWEARQPVQVTKSLHLPRFTLKSYDTANCTSETTTGKYSCIKVLLKLSRQFGYYLFQVYVPSIALVILSWVSFWLDQRAIVARVAICVAVLLTLAINMAAINAKLPAVSYTKAIDVWSGTCLMFVFAVVFELVWVMQCVSAEDKKNLEANVSVDDSVAKKHASDHGNKGSKSRFGIVGRFFIKYPTRGQKVDAISRVLFPLVFAFFNLVYWSIYSQRINLEGIKYS